MRNKKNSKNCQSQIQEDKERFENEIRSFLRYAWQKTVTYIQYYNPPLLDIKNNLLENFMAFIKNTNPNKEKIRQTLELSFTSILKNLLKEKDITNQKLEDSFIDITMYNLKRFLV